MNHHDVHYADDGDEGRRDGDDAKEDAEQQPMGVKGSLQMIITSLHHHLMIHQVFMGASGVSSVYFYKVDYDDGEE